MIIKQGLIAMLCLWLSYSHLHAQMDNMQPLRLQATVPNVQLTLLNHTGAPASLSNYTGKLVILDFWATTCAACIKALPELQAVQQQFGDSIQILAVTYEDAATVAKAMQRNKYLSGLTLPIVVNDTALQNLFKHTYLPHDVWIKDGRVAAITTNEYITAANIRRLFQQGIVHWPVKNDDLVFDINQPLLRFDSSSELQPPMYYSFMSRHINGVSPATYNKTDSGAHTRRFAVVNHPLLHLYAYAMPYLGGLPLQPKRTVLHVADSGRYILNGYRDVWEQTNTWSFETVAAATAADEDIEGLLKQSLDAYFGLHATAEELPVTCWVIQQEAGTKPPTVKPTAGEKEISDSSEYLVVRHATMQDVVYALNNRPGLPLTIDETGSSRSLSINISPAALNNMEGLQAALLPYGFTVTEQIRNMQMFVLTETAKTPVVLAP